MIFYCLNQEAKKILEGEVDELFAGFDPEYGPPLISLHRHTLSDRTDLYESVQEKVVKDHCLMIFLCLKDKEDNVVQSTMWTDNERDIIAKSILQCPLAK